MSEKIILLGDVVRHVYLKPVEETNTAYEKKGEYKVFTQGMKSGDDTMECSPIISQMITKAIGNKKIDNETIKPDYKFTYQSDKPELSLFRVIKKYPRTSSKTNDKLTTWRTDPSSEYFGSKLYSVSKDYTLAQPTSSDNISNNSELDTFAIMQQLFQNINNINDNEEIALLVLYDRNSELRKFLTVSTSKDKLIYKINQEIHKIIHNYNAPSKKEYNEIIAKYLEGLKLSKADLKSELKSIENPLCHRNIVIKIAKFERDFQLTLEKINTVRKNTDKLLKDSTTAETTLTYLCKSSKNIVIGIREGVNDKIWLDKLKNLTTGHEQKCIVILCVDDLRNAGLKITEHGTNEQNIREIVGYLKQEPLNLIWGKICTHIVFIFRETQVLYLNKTSGNGKISYHYCPHFDRPAQIRPSLYGKMPGKFTILMTAIIKSLYSESSIDDAIINKALRFGILAYNRYFDEGYCNNNDKPPNPFDAILDAVDIKEATKLYEYSWNEEKKEFHLSTLEVNIKQIEDDIANIEKNKYNKSYCFHTNSRNKVWGRSDALFNYYNTDNITGLGLENDLKQCNGTKKEREEKFVLHRIVKQGLKSLTYLVNYSHNKIDSLDDINLFSESKIICPHLELKKTNIIDEENMNGFIDLAQLLRNYLNPCNKSEQPLSIAVFGPPGEGKSFSIKQIIKHVSPERKSEDLTFNLAQFDSTEQLTEAFHQIQDRVLKHQDLGEPPLIIFDEFDAKFRDQPLGWLKFFLAPMQDDLFRGKSVEYQVGRAIFIFSGGTCETFSEFNGRFSNREEEEKRKDVKLTDFIGRLRGFMDVKGINSPKGILSRTVKLRRAMVLRSLLEKRAEHIFDANKKSARIHDKIIEAFLETKRYKFGIRSMEAIIQMSRWIDKEFIPASLPSLQQLELHIETQAFEKILKPY
jgi:hypothetical protein